MSDLESASTQTTNTATPVLPLQTSMDLSQQELPLTTYFTRSSRELRLRAVQSKRKTAGPVESSQSPARSPKRRRTKVQCAASSSKPSPAALQLPTPAASAKKPVRGKQFLHKTRVTALSSAKPSTTLSSEEDLTQPDSGSAPSQPLREPGEAAIIATLSTVWETAAEPTGIVSPPSCRLGNTETSLITPQTLSRKIPRATHDIHDQSPLAHSICCSLPKPIQVHSISACSPVAADSYDPFRACEKDSRTLLPQEDSSLQVERRFIQSETPNDQASDNPPISAIPVPSSQSQYLLHPDATPKRKRYPRRIDDVGSSQTQEEVELTLAMPRNPIAPVSSLVGHTLATFAPFRDLRVPHISSSKQQNHSYTLPCVAIGHPNSPSSSRCHANNKTPDERSFKLSSPTRRRPSTPSRSPSCKNQRKMPRSPVRQPNIPPTHAEEDSLTEPESDLDVIQVPPRSLIPKDACTSVRSGFIQDNLPSTEDDSATEAESDTEFNKCLAEIGRKSHATHRAKISKEHLPAPPVISPLVSPTRPRVVTGPLNLDFSQFSTQEGAGLSVPGSRIPFASALEQIQARTESLPLVVRDFVHMFPGDESYPADFPESLRV